MARPRRNWIQEERRKTLGDYTCFCLGCGAVWRYFLEGEAELPAECPQCGGETRHRCPRVPRRFPLRSRSSARSAAPRCARPRCSASGSASRAAEVEEHAPLAVTRLELDVADPLVQALRRVVAVDAQGDAGQAVAPCPFVHRVEQLLADTAPAVPVGDRDRELGRLLVDEAVAVLVLGEEAAPGRADELSVLLRDDGGIARPAPAAVVDHDQLVREHELARRQLSVSSPVERGVEHLAEEVQLVAAELADLHRPRARTSSR